MPTKYYLTVKEFDHLKTAAREADIHELCYLVFGRGGHIERVIQVPNRAEDTVLNHVISRDDYERARGRKSVAHLKCLGFLHTHPISPAVPSDGDIDGYPNCTLIFIYSDTDEEIRAFRLISARPGYTEKTVLLTKKRRGTNRRAKKGGHH